MLSIYLWTCVCGTPNPKSICWNCGKHQEDVFGKKIGEVYNIKLVVNGRDCPEKIELEEEVQMIEIPYGWCVQKMPQSEGTDVVFVVGLGTERLWAVVDFLHKNMVSRL
ncbi:MAG: hypothetical protein ABIB98_03940 [bacterium]